MKRRYLLHEINHTMLLVAITTIGLPNEIYSPEGKEQLLPSKRFQSWKAAREFLLRAGTGADLLSKTEDKLRATSVVVLTILE